jgi:hypothetical protein
MRGRSGLFKKERGGLVSRWDKLQWSVRARECVCVAGQSVRTRAVKGGHGGREVPYLQHVLRIVEEALGVVLFFCLGGGGVDESSAGRQNLVPTTDLERRLLKEDLGLALVAVHAAARLIQIAQGVEGGAVPQLGGALQEIHRLWAYCKINECFASFQFHFMHCPRKCARVLRMEEEETVAAKTLSKKAGRSAAPDKATIAHRSHQVQILWEAQAPHRQPVGALLGFGPERVEDAEVAHRARVALGGRLSQGFGWLGGWVMG